MRVSFMEIYGQQDDITMRATTEWSCGRKICGFVRLDNANYGE